MVGSADLSWHGEPRATADEPGHGHAVVRSAEGARPVQRSTGQEVAQKASDLRHLERLSQLERRQDAGEAPGEHGLPGTGRATQQQVVAAGGGDLDRAPGLFLSVDLGEVGIENAGGRVGRDIGEELGRDQRVPEQMREHACQVFARDDL